MKLYSRNIFLLLGCGILPLFTQNIVIRILCITVILLVVVDILSAVISRRCVVFNRETVSCIASRGTSFSVRFSVHNISPFPLRNILVEDRTKGLFSKNRPIYLITLRPFEERSFTYTLEGNQRGIYHLGPISVSAQGFFLLTPWTVEYDKSCRVTILPPRKRILTRDVRGNAGGVISTNLPQYEDMTQYRSFRPYEPGDELKRIHWKISAKQGRLMTAEYERQISVPVTVILNLTDSDFCSHHGSDLMEKGVEAAASILAHCERLGQTASLVVNGRDSEFHSMSGNSFHFSRMAETLAAARLGPRRETFPHLEKVLSTNAYQRIFIITPPLQKEHSFWLGHFASSPRLRVSLLILKCGDIRIEDSMLSLCSGMESSHLSITKRKLELPHG